MIYILGKFAMLCLKAFYASSSVHNGDDKHTPLFEVEWRVTPGSQGGFMKECKANVKDLTNNHLEMKMCFNGDSIN